MYKLTIILYRYCTEYLQKPTCTCTCTCTYFYFMRQRYALLLLLLPRLLRIRPSAFMYRSVSMYQVSISTMTRWMHLQLALSCDICMYHVVHEISCMALDCNSNLVKNNLKLSSIYSVNVIFSFYYYWITTITKIYTLHICFNSLFIHYSK